MRLVTDHGLLAFNQGLNATAGVFVQARPRISEFGATYRTFEQLHLQLLFKLANASTQGR
ncbi:hypothetical protein D3C84_1128840 [compost metagenome]